MHYLVSDLVSVIDDHTTPGPPSDLAAIDVPNLDVARKLTTEASEVCNRKTEVRPFP